MIGKPYNTQNPTVYTCPWDAYNDPTAQIVPSSSPSSLSVNVTASPNSPNASLYLDALLTALELAITDPVEPNGVDSDEFRMYEFKVRGCTRAKAHDWTECPFAHPGEKARRRDPRRCSYSGTACADFRKGGCRRGDACEFAHGVFECWLHPTRYRTQACKDGPGCTRRVCFFAHSPGQLRAVSGLPSPGSIGPGSPDPFEEFSAGVELSPTTGRVYGPSTVGDLAVKLRNLQLSKVKAMVTGSGWKGRAELTSPRLGLSTGEVVRAGFYSQPGTPTRSVFRVGGVGYPWDEEPNKEGVGLSGENRLGIEEPVDSNASGSAPDIGWVSELVK